MLLLGGNGEAEIGTPMVDGARVVAEVIEHGRGRKIIVFKYKNKTRYRRKAGHRQEFTRLSVKEIVTASGAYTAEAPEKKKPTRKSRASLAEPDAEEVKAEVPVETEAVATEAPEAIAEVPEAGTKPKAVRKATARKAAADGDSEDKPKPRARTTKPKAEPEAKEPSSDVESTEETG